MVAKWPKYNTNFVGTLSENPHTSATAFRSCAISFASAVKGGTTRRLCNLQQSFDQSAGIDSVPVVLQSVYLFIVDQM